jgi:hypothetical protein
MRIPSLLFTFVLSSAPVAAQNCANTSIPGLVPLGDLGPGLYQGFAGGLYPGSSNAIPVPHFVRGMNQAVQVVPRDAAGQPSPNGKIVFLSIGMSNCTQEFSTFVPLANADPARSPRVACVDGAQGGQTAAIIQDPTANFWTVVDQRLSNQGLSPQQVQVIWFKEADAGPTSGFPAYAQTLQTEFTAIMHVIVARYPNARICYLASRIYAGYATSALNPEPYAYEQGFSCKWLIEQQIAGQPALNFDPARGAVVAPWCAWGTYNWANGLLPRSDGLTWACADFVTDGTHPSASGRAKVAQALFDFLHADPIAGAWYLRAPAPHEYGEGKLSSIGTRPTLGWSGSPSLASDDFSVLVAGGLPNSNGLVFFGARAADLPFFGATRWVASPLSRLAVHALDGAGATSYAIHVQPSMVGTTRFYQALLRDAQQPDGTGVIVSDGLRVVFSD